MCNAILWVLGTGAPWRDLPAKYGPWKSVYTRFRRWSRRGVWDQVLKEIGKDQDQESWIIDATIVRAHHDATGGKKGIITPSERAEEAPVRRFTPSSML